MTIQTDQRIATDRDVNLNAVSPAFFATLGIRIVAGRDFDERDSRPVGETGARSAIINEAFVKRYLRGRSPLGVRICGGSGPDAKPNVEVVGVVGISTIAVYATSRNRRTSRFSKATMLPAIST